MSASTVRGYALRAPDDAFNATQPVSSWRATELCSNLLHFTDEFCQHRVNWIATDPEVGTDGIEGSQAITRVWCQAYPHTWLGPNKPANVDLHVQAAGILSDATLWFRLVPNSARIGDLSAPAVFSETQLFNQAGGAVNDYTLTHLNDEASTRVFQSGWAQPGVVLDSAGTAHAVSQCMMRLEIICLDGSNSFQVYGVLLREFA